jgi:hypothetical protein
MKSLADFDHYDTVYVDAMNLLARSYYGIRNMSHTGRNTAMLFGVARMALEMRRKYPGISVVLLWEGSGSFRKAKYPIYKAQRTYGSGVEDRREFNDAVDLVRYSLSLMGISQAFAETYEADDLAYYYARHSQGKTLFSSGDWDWWALIDYGDILYQHNTLCKRDDLSNLFCKKFGVPAIDFSKLWVFKVLTGDSSDNVDGVPRFPRKLAARIACNPIDTVADIPRLLHDWNESVWAEKVSRHLWVLERNVELLCLADVPESAVVHTRAVYDRDAFLSVLKDNAMVGLAMKYFDEDVTGGRDGTSSDT